MPLLESVYRFAGGSLRVALKYETSTRTIRQISFSGDLVVTPRRALADLEAALRDVPMKRLARHVESFFASRPAFVSALEPRDFVAAVTLATGQPLDA
jgi:lipoate-protein ligase A